LYQTQIHMYIFQIYVYIHTIFEIRIDFEINKYKYHRRLNVGLAVYTAADLGDIWFHVPNYNL